MYAGFSNELVVALAVAGILALLFEMHVLPGHGVAGVLGLILLLTADRALVRLSVLLRGRAIDRDRDRAFRARVLGRVAGLAGERIHEADRLHGRARPRLRFVRPTTPRCWATWAMPLLPAARRGRQVDGKRIDVLTEGDFVAAGSPVRVTRVEGARIFVEPLPSVALRFAEGTNMTQIFGPMIFLRSSPASS